MSVLVNTVKYNANCLPPDNKRQAAGAILAHMRDQSEHIAGRDLELCNPSIKDAFVGGQQAPQKRVDGCASMLLGRQGIDNDSG
jgi:hypothetical protein